MKFTRREVLAGAAALAATPLFAQSTGGWYDKPMRWAQVAFTEDDPGHYDPAFWRDYFKRIHADGACLSAGGCVAFYPTKIPYHYKSPFLGNRDIFGEMTAVCRKLNMNVIARTDPHACNESAFKAHPEWVQRLQDGSPRRHWAAPDLWVTCPLGPYNFDFMTQVTKEIMSTYAVDGVFSNRWAGNEVCYCESCKTLFRKFSGFDVPVTKNIEDKARKQYVIWREQRLFELWHVWDDAIRAINPRASFIANSGGGALSELDMKKLGELTQILFADRQARRGVMPPWSNGKNGKEYRATMGMKPIGGIFSIGVEEPYRWKDSVQSPAEIRIWAADGIAHGLRPWFVKFNAKPLDKRWLPVVEEIYQWHDKNEKYLRNRENLARVGLVYSQNTARFYGGERAHDLVEDHQLGMYQALVESRIPFEMVHDGLLDAGHLEPYRLLILPNIAALSDKQCAQIKSYVEGGGRIMATHETSLYDEWGQRRANFGLSSLFGCDYGGKVHERQQNSYFAIERGAGELAALVSGLEDTERIINAVKRVELKNVQGGKPPLTVIPTYPDLPMERVFTDVTHTNIPGVICRAAGKGRVVYFPNDIDRTFWEVLSSDHLRVLQNAVDWALDEPRQVEIKGAGMLDVALWDTNGGMALHIVNLTNPMAMKGPFREIVPVGPLEVKVHMPTRRRPTSIKLLTAGIEVSGKYADGFFTFTVPRVDVHEVVIL